VRWGRESVSNSFSLGERARGRASTGFRKLGKGKSGGILRRGRAGTFDQQKTGKKKRGDG